MKLRAKLTKNKDRKGPQETEHARISSLTKCWPQIEERLPEPMWKPVCWPTGIKIPPDAQRL